jgi:hypothetical protein
MEAASTYKKQVNLRQTARCSSHLQCKVSYGTPAALCLLAANVYFDFTVRVEQRRLKWISVRPTAVATCPNAHSIRDGTDDNGQCSVPGDLTYIKDLSRQAAEVSSLPWQTCVWVSTEKLAVAQMDKELLAFNGLRKISNFFIWNCYWTMFWDRRTSVHVFQHMRRWIML